MKARRYVSFKTQDSGRPKSFLVIRGAGDAALFHGDLSATITTDFQKSFLMHANRKLAALLCFTSAKKCQVLGLCMVCFWYVRRQIFGARQRYEETKLKLHARRKKNT